MINFSRRVATSVKTQKPTIAPNFGRDRFIQVKSSAW
jgi:hypothetical protein